LCLSAESQHGAKQAFFNLQIYNSVLHPMHLVSFFPFIVLFLILFLTLISRPVLNFIFLLLIIRFKSNFIDNYFMHLDLFKWEYFFCILLFLIFNIHFIQ